MIHPTYHVAKKFILLTLITTMFSIYGNVKTADAAARGLANGGYSIAILPNGTVYVGGTFSKAGGKPAYNIAKWDGNSWSSLGQGCNNEGVITLALGPDGSVYAGGWITEAGGKPVKCSAKWNGNSWSPMGSEMEQLEKIRVAPNGNVFAIGEMGTGKFLVAQYTQNKWISLEQGQQFGNVSDITIGQDGTLYAFAESKVFKWDGIKWKAIGENFGSRWGVLAVSPDNTLYVASHDFGKSSSLKKWNGSIWEGIGLPAKGVVRQIEFAKDGTLYAMIADEKKSTTFYISKFDGKIWNTVIKDTNNFLDTFALSQDNTLYVVGFLLPQGPKGKTFYAAKWDGGKWNIMSPGVTD